MKKGDKIQDFTLKNTDASDVTFSEIQKGEKTLILFFPLAFSSVCTKELCGVRDDLKLYKSLNAKIIGISVDSFYTLREFKKANNLSFPLLSDFNKNVSKQFGALYEDFFGMKGVSKRAAFVIDKDMTVEYAEVLEDPKDVPDFKSIQEVLEEE